MRKWTGPILGLCLVASVAQAHHSLSAYDQNRSVTAEGTVEDYHFSNPHPVLMIAVTAPSGGKQIWRLEMDNLHELVDVGISKTTFKYGDKVTATGWPDKSSPTGVYLRRLDRPSDGLRYEQIGLSPRVTYTKGPG